MAGRSFSKSQRAGAVACSTRRSESAKQAASRLSSTTVPEKGTCIATLTPPKSNKVASAVALRVRHAASSPLADDERSGSASFNSIGARGNRNGGGLYANELGVRRRRP